MTAGKTAQILKNLRNVMSSNQYVTQNLQAYVIPGADAHQSEYISICDDRRKFVSGFTGSNGTAIVTTDKAALWTDRRYFLQAQNELDSNWILMKMGYPDVPSYEDWLTKILPSGSCVGFDPFLLSYNSWRQWSMKLETFGISMIPIQQNLVDIIWENRPASPIKPIEMLPEKYTGMSFEEKIRSVREDMVEKKASVLVLTALDETAWLFNLRGSDIIYNPVFFAYTVLTLDQIYLFVDEKKLSPEIREKFEGSKVTIEPYDTIKEFMQSLDKSNKVWISKYSSYALVSTIPKDNRILELNPVVLKKAVKNEQEIKCMKWAHVKDAVALCEFFHWLEVTLGKEEITELSASAKLESFRKKQEDFVSDSFGTISASGGNGAIIHYSPTTATNRVVSVDEMYLNDSGAQYRDGTTDVTRTVHFGKPSDYQKECYTRVLKGHISLSSALFPVGIKGSMLDSFARKSLWDVGLDYNHGTGHGVGMFLNVHEGPMGISNEGYFEDPGLKEGMILSIEPGYYEKDKFGIRIENLAVIVKAESKYKLVDKSFLKFEPLTLVPMQTKLVDPSLLTIEEIDWINIYHNKCCEVVGQALEKQNKFEALKWLIKETVPIAGGSKSVY